MDSTKTLVRVGSHRARSKLEQLLGYLPQGYFSFYRPGEFREVPADKAEAALQIKGISKARWHDDFRKYLLT